ncbi:hypothetical protein X777_13429 [Ooceraea biroi]|uniref:Uncharacterized protein n=1 Tax=Ooceraea biroi TaxID=2015173 RepID=A0A026WW95_OOCBI|nr:hypothetical protein X777_13429 [Ooceraea biroi]
MRRTTTKRTRTKRSREKGRKEDWTTTTTSEQHDHAHIPAKRDRKRARVRERVSRTCEIAVRPTHTVVADRRGRQGARASKMEGRRAYQRLLIAKEKKPSAPKLEGTTGITIGQVSDGTALIGRGAISCSPVRVNFARPSLTTDEKIHSCYVLFKKITFVQDVDTYACMPHKRAGKRARWAMLSDTASPRSRGLAV